MGSEDVAMNNMSGSEIDVEIEALKDCIDEVLLQVNQLEQRLPDLEQFFSDESKKNLSSSKASSISKDKHKGKHISRIHVQQEDATIVESDASKRMQELLRQIGTILRQYILRKIMSMLPQVDEVQSLRPKSKISLHKWAWPFMEPVDVKGLCLDDYYEIIKNPMDLGTIKKKLEAKDGCGYKHVREACADVRLVFENAMKYNGETNDCHVMAKTLLAKFEEKWLQLLPKVMEEENRLAEEETEAQLNVQLAQESPHPHIILHCCISTACIIIDTASSALVIFITFNSTRCTSSLLLSSVRT